MDENTTSEALSDAAFAKVLENCANEITLKDGDRDYMNPSNLTVQDTLATADLMRLAALRLTRETDYARRACAE